VRAGPVGAEGYGEGDRPLGLGRPVGGEVALVTAEQRERPQREGGRRRPAEPRPSPPPSRPADHQARRPEADTEADDAAGEDVDEVVGAEVHAGHPRHHRPEAEPGRGQGPRGAEGPREGERRARVARGKGVARVAGQRTLELEGQLEQVGHDPRGQHGGERGEAGPPATGVPAEDAGDEDEPGDGQPHPPVAQRSHAQHQPVDGRPADHRADGVELGHRGARGPGRAERYPTRCLRAAGQVEAGAVAPPLVRFRP